MGPTVTMAPTYTYVPMKLRGVIPELESLGKLQEAEKKLDISIKEKENQLSLGIEGCGVEDPTTGKQILRVFIYNTASNQSWQEHAEDEQPSWKLRVEGKLLDNEGKEVEPVRKFSDLIQAIAVDFKKTKVRHRKQDGGSKTADIEMKDANEVSGDTGVQSSNVNGDNDEDDEDDEDEDEDDGTIIDTIEWIYDPLNESEFDGIDVQRPGIHNIDCTITIQPRGVTGQEVQYSSELSHILGTKLGSVQSAVYGLYKYILNNNLMNNNDKNITTSATENSQELKTMVNIDQALSKLLPKKDFTEQALDQNRIVTMSLEELVTMVNSHVTPLEPSKINYTIRTDVESTYGEKTYDIEIKQKENKKNAFSTYQDTQRDEQDNLEEIDTEINKLQLQLNSLATKYQFFKETQNNPKAVLKEYALISANATKVLQSDQDYTEDTVRLSDFYKKNEAVLFEYLATYLANSRL